MSASSIAYQTSVIIVVICLSLTQTQVIAQQTCRTPLGDAGTCVSLKFCPQVVHLFTQLKQYEAKQYSRALQRLCGNQITPDNYPVVCCSRIVLSEMETTTKMTTTTTTSTTIRPTSTPTTVAQKDERSFLHPTEDSASCRGPVLENGYCKPLEDCPELLNRLRSKPQDEVFLSYLRTSNKICGSVGTDVCCSTTSNKTAASADNVPHQFPTEEERCGYATQDLTKVVGGRDSRIGAWPWIALIGYEVYSHAPFRCGGTLVTTRHVITAAHCINKDLSFVRLGEFDLSTDTETQHVDIDVSKMVSHPDFGGRDGRNDIAVLLLDKTVQITNLICPICMPTSNYMRSKSYVGSNPFVAGWGRTKEGGSPATKLQQLQIPVLENAVCRNSYEVNNRLFSQQQFDDSVVCAGVLQGGMDTCQGDSGGPLMIPEPYKGTTRYYLIGVVSYGIGCANLGIPGVYTSTRHFMDWLKEQITQM